MAQPEILVVTKREAPFPHSVHMSRTAATRNPPCYAMVHPGLEEVAGEEIARVWADIKKAGLGIVVFRVPEIDRPS